MVPGPGVRYTLDCAIITGPSIAKYKNSTKIIFILYYGDILGGSAVRPGQDSKMLKLWDSVPAGLVVVDGDLKVDGYNHAWSELCNEYLGCKIAGGMDISRLLPDEGPVKMLVEALHGKTIKRDGYRFEKTLPSAGERYFDLTAVPVAGNGAMLLAVDATERHRDLMSTDAAKTEAEFYVDLMSHDIRNFNQITMGYIELLLLGENLSDTEQAYLEKAQKGVTGSNKLIDNIKKIRLIRQFAGKDLAKTDLGEIVEKDAGDVRKAFPAARISLDMDKKEAHSVRADEYVHEIFRHILENAVKYDPHPEKIIEVSVKPLRRDGANYWSVSIADRGPGVPDDKKTSVFERMTRTTKGAGVGLSIVSVIVFKYGGRIYVGDRVQGDPSQGSVFVIELPQAKT